MLYYCTEASNMEKTGNKECDDYIKQMLKHVNMHTKYFITLFSRRYVTLFYLSYFIHSLFNVDV